MKSERILIPIACVFVASAILYIVSYTAIEHRRQRQGPWIVTFSSTNEIPTVTINQPALGITNVQFEFPGGELPQSFAPRTATFEEARPVPFSIPFGQCLFLDTTFLPGTVVLELFGHEVQLIPRTLTIGNQERPWRSHEVISLAATNVAPVFP